MTQPNVLPTACSGLIPGREYTIVRRLAGGGQGEVYLARDGDREVALKVYHAHMGGAEQEAMVRAQVAKRMNGTPEERRFVWPQDLVRIAAWNRWGYVMPLVDRGRFLDLGELQARRGQVTMSPRRLAEAGYQLSSSMRALHLAGHCYRDISRNNILFDPATGQIRIIDNDNVGVAGDSKSGVVGTPEYMAPEIITGRAAPSTETDLHALAVLLFEMWTWHHPLHGDQESRIHVWDLLAKQRIYGEQPVFIFDPVNDANRPNDPDYRGVRRAWEIMPETLRRLFTVAFTEGLREPARRVTEGQWQQAFLQLFDGALRCPCGAELLWDPSVAGPLKCWNCRKAVAVPPRLRIDTGAAPFHLPLMPDAQLLGHHLRPSHGRGEPPELVGQVVPHPTVPGVWGLRNLSGMAWTFVGMDGATQLVPPLRSAPLTLGARVMIQNRTCTIES